MAERKGGVAAPATTSTVYARDWDAQHVANERFDNVLFVDIDLVEATTTSTTFFECTFRGVKFNVSRHESSGFINCTFIGCGFFDATFSGCKLSGSMFNRCTYDLLKAEGGDWSFVGLPGADLRRTTFTKVRMREADLTGARCAGATFHGVDLSGAWLHKADFTGADLRGSDLTSLDPTTVELRGAIIEPAQAMVVASSLGLEIR
ncbi:hypothetical protein BLA60_40595 [Actinophytocola xinjiangensis]|uniref:Pentapeptide repeat protein n=1 Tax=Actinophytocola xinjiangensis TaxID=485602 RepID=A0A7Z1AUG4_9PSEU|nr:pentapeptide repeat-containing protein [Actinophytocola xinjiangensis]OLF04488.1 hypothetical protein BLA60_40595 [Actinophytocola xinjiangensis]